MDPYGMKRISLVTATLLFSAFFEQCRAVEIPRMTMEDIHYLTQLDYDLGLSADDKLVGERWINQWAVDVILGRNKEKTQRVLNCRNDRSQLALVARQTIPLLEFTQMHLNRFGPSSLGDCTDLIMCYTEAVIKLTNDLSFTSLQAEFDPTQELASGQVYENAIKQYETYVDRRNSEALALEKSVDGLDPVDVSMSVETEGRTVDSYGKEITVATRGTGYGQVDVFRHQRHQAYKKAAARWQDARVLRLALFILRVKYAEALRLPITIQTTADTQTQDGRSQKRQQEYQDMKKDGTPAAILQDYHR